MSYAVIIPSYNRPGMLKRALASVYAQTVLPKAIHLIVDEPEAVDKYDFLQDYDARLKVVFTGGGFGGAKARNVGLDQVEDVDYVFFLDDDDEWLPEKIGKQMELLDSRPEAVGVTCECYICSEGNRRLMDRDEEKINRYIKLWNFTGGFSCFGVRWNSATASMRLRDSLGSAQDFEYYIRIAEAGLIALLAEPQVLFYWHDEGRISGDPVKKRQSYREIIRMNPELFDRRERFFLQAKGDIRCAQYLESYMHAFLAHCRGAMMLVLACRWPSMSWKLWWTGFRGMVLRGIRGKS